MLEMVLLTVLGIVFAATGVASLVVGYAILRDGIERRDRIEICMALLVLLYSVMILVGVAAMFLMMLGYCR